MNTVARPFAAWLLAAVATFVVFGVATAPAHAGTTTGSGKLASDARPVSAFDAIALTGSIELVVRQAEKEAVEVRTDDNLLSLVETVVEPSSRGQTLVIRVKRGENVRPSQNIKVTVDVAKLSHLSSAGSGDLKLQALRTPALRLVMSGSGDADISDLRSEQLEVHVAGSGNVQASGQATQVKLSIAGSGNVGLKSLIADDVSVRIAGSGDAKVTANKALGVSIAGSGDVEYSGNATAIRTSVAGSGRIVKR